MSSKEERINEVPKSELSTIAQLFAEIQRRASELVREGDTRTGLDSLLLQSISQAMDEIRRGANVEEFQELAVVNLLLVGPEAGYSTDELRAFVNALKLDS